MSTREMALNIFNSLSDEQLAAFVTLFSGMSVGESPNSKTVRAIKEADDIISGKAVSKGYSSSEELFRDIDNEI